MTRGCQLRCSAFSHIVPLLFGPFNWTDGTSFLAFPVRIGSEESENAYERNSFVQMWIYLAMMKRLTSVQICTNNSKRLTCVQICTNNSNRMTSVQISTNNSNLLTTVHFGNNYSNLLTTVHFWNNYSNLLTTVHFCNENSDCKFAAEPCIVMLEILVAKAKTHSSLSFP